MTPLRRHPRLRAALARWEIPAFRESGERWLATNSWKCTVSSPGGGRGGGSRHAH